MTMRKCKILMCLLLCAGAVSTAEYGSTQVHAEVKAADYLLPDADTRYYTEDEIRGMSAKILCYAKNEIYARHGRKFQSEELQEYFGLQPWYYGRIEPGDFSEEVFNKYEKANIQLLTEKEFELQSGGYVLDQPGYGFDDVDAYIYGSGSGFYIASGVSLHSSGEMVQFETDYFTISLPGDLEWEYEINGTDSISFFYTPAKESGTGGRFLEITAYDWGDNGYEPWPRWQIAGLDEEKKYIAILPTDVQYDYTDSVQTEEYQRLLKCAESCSQDNEDTVFFVKNP